MAGIKEELTKKAENTKGETKLTKSALNTTPKLRECTQMQIISAQAVYENDCFSYLMFPKRYTTGMVGTYMTIHSYTIPARPVVKKRCTIILSPKMSDFGCPKI